MKRLLKLDEARGVTLISMILYHFMWDLKYLANFKMDWYVGPIGRIWQQSICISFILISGFSFCLGRHNLKRSLIVFCSGILVSVVTLITMPENRIVFGILTFIGSAGLIMIPVSYIHNKLEKKLDNLNLNLTMLIGSLLLFIVFYPVNNGYLNLIVKKIFISGYINKGYVATYWGFTDNTFYSTDYFSLFPWIFVYLFGYYLYRILCIEKDEIKGIYIKSDYLKKPVSDYLSRDSLKSLEFIGSHTLIIYLLHQPVLYLITQIIEMM